MTFLSTDSNRNAQKVSIITCFLNVESFLEEMIESVLHQTYLNWELWLVDDGSLDEGSVIAKKYAALFPGKIFYLEHPDHSNEGTSISRNLAIEKATGELLAFLDGDDVWMPGYLTTIIECYCKQQATMVCEASLYWHSWTDNNQTDYKLHVGVAQNKLYEPPELIKNLYPLATGAAPCICGLIVEKRAVIECGGFEKSFQGMYDDQALLVKLYLREKIYVSSGCNNKYRQRNQSLVHASHKDGNYRKERILFFKWMQDYFKIDHQHSLPAIEQRIKNELFSLRFPLVDKVMRFKQKLQKKLL